MKVFNVLIALVLSLVVSTSYASDFTGKVVRVSDGDTATILNARKKQVRVRFDSIDAPESGQPYGNNARQALSDKIFGKEVRVIIEDTDHYGRIVGTVMLGNRNINMEMVQEGHAWAYRQYLKDRRYIQAETEAKKASLGLWGLQKDQIMAPWDWRRAKRNGTLTVNPAASAPAATFQCGTKQYCRQMASCDEAKFFLKQCGVTTLDGNNDGVPCEAICR